MIQFKIMHIAHVTDPSQPEGVYPQEVTDEEFEEMQDEIQYDEWVIAFIVADDIPLEATRMLRGFNSQVQAQMALDDIVASAKSL